jgi:hydrogenase 3 maturation protease
MGKLPTLTPSWQKTLRQLLSDSLITNPSARIAILGVGNELNGDDAVGPKIVHSLQNYQAKGKITRPVLLVDTGLAPENFVGLLRGQNPGLVVLIDAAQMGLLPGEIRWLSAEEIDGFSASTHTLPLSILSGYLEKELGCKVEILGIEPFQVDPFQPLSQPVAKGMKNVINEFKDLLK